MRTILAANQGARRSIQMGRIRSSFSVRHLSYDKEASISCIPVSYTHLPLGASRERIEAFVKRNSAWIISRLAQREQRQATAQEPLSPSSIIALWGKPITVQDALDHNFKSPAPRPKQATFASFMGTDEPDERPQAKWNAPLDGLTPSEIQAHIDQLYTSEVTSALRDMAVSYTHLMLAPMRCFQYSVASQYGTHVDAPRHFHVDGRSLGEIEPIEFMHPLCVIDKHEECAANPEMCIRDRFRGLQKLLAIMHLELRICNEKTD